ncbi:MAG: ester cyclase [Candidatus Dormibacteraeota bacterium]|nr:ester cyclase [Candidatus Dormibacteraeota bacterium]
MSENENKQLLRRYYEEVLTQGRLDVLETIARPDHVEHNPLPGQAQGLEGLRQRASILRAAVNPQFTLEHVIAEGDKVAVMWTSRGTHVGEWFGMPPTGKSFTIQGVDVHQLRDGRMAEHWDVVDIYSMLIQLGALPAPSGVAG